MLQNQKIKNLMIFLIIWLNMIHLPPIMNIYSELLMAFTHQACQILDYKKILITQMQECFKNLFQIMLPQENVLQQQVELKITKNMLILLRKDQENFIMFQKVNMSERKQNILVESIEHGLKHQQQISLLHLSLFHGSLMMYKLFM